MLLNEAGALKYGSMRSFGIYLSSVFGSVKQLTVKI